MKHGRYELEKGVIAIWSRVEAEGDEPSRIHIQVSKGESTVGALVGTPQRGSNLGLIWEWTDRGDLNAAQMYVIECDLMYAIANGRLS